MTLAFDQAVNSPSPGALVELYQIDASAVGGGIFNFTPMTNDSTLSVTFGGTLYTALPIETDGWAWSAVGAPPRPVLRVSNVNKFLHYAVLSMGDLVGAKLIRFRTFNQFLDGGAQADASARFPDDVYIIEQKTAHNKLLIEWTLSAIVDRGGMRLPRRQILRDKNFPGVAKIRRL